MVWTSLFGSGCIISPFHFFSSNSNPFDTRYFSKSFTIAEDVEIKGAELKDGLLIVSMEKVIPEHKKARTIEIK